MHLTGEIFVTTSCIFSQEWDTGPVYGQEPPPQAIPILYNPKVPEEMTAFMLRQRYLRLCLSMRACWEGEVTSLTDQCQVRLTGC